MTEFRLLKVRLVSPAMIGGARGSSCDRPAFLRPPSVRGMLRFWTRALAPDAAMREVEAALWGAPDERIGQRVALRTVPAAFRSLPKPETRFLLPHKSKEGKKDKRSRTEMILPAQPPRTDVLIHVRIPPATDREQLTAAFWIWLHLGGIGRRSRRGYGSLQWVPTKEDLLTGWPRWSGNDRASLETTLKDGLERAWAAFGTTPESVRVARTHRYRLWGLDQVFVGQSLNRKFDATTDKAERYTGGMEYAIHGWRDPHPSELGEPPGDRLASPMLWRVFPVGSGYVPVMTWSPYPVCVNDFETPAFCI